MELTKLNPNQASHRAGQITKSLGGIAPESIKDVLVVGGFWKLLEDAGLITGETLDHDLTPDEKFEKMLDALYRSGLRGDSQAARAYRDLASEKANRNAFNLVVEETPYTIADKSLHDITLDADEVPVREIMEAFAERIELDGCPPEMVRRIRQIHDDWQEWAKTGLKARGGDDQEDAPVSVETVDTFIESLGLDGPDDDDSPF